jgi:hypothetical protein
MSTDWINRGILLAMVVIVACAYVALYDYASSDFRLYVPFGIAMLIGLVIYDVARKRKPPKR